MSVPVTFVDVPPTKCYSGSDILHPDTVDVTFDYMIPLRRKSRTRVLVRNRLMSDL